MKLEDSSSLSQKSLSSTPTESLSSPIYLHNSTQFHHHNNTISNQCSNPEDSETAREFLSNSLDFSPTQEEKSLPEKTLLSPPEFVEEIEVDEIGLLIELLGLSDFEGGNSNLDLESCSSCHCGSGFLGKIAGVKGPKCKKEMERLDGWISYFRDEKIEPFRLAHLLLGKAAFLYGSGDGMSDEELEIPSTVDEFLRHDPPNAKDLDLR